MRWKAYPKYKDSGVAWLGKVPEHWEAKRGRFVISVNPSSNILRSLDKKDIVSFIPMDAVGEHGDLKLDQTRTLEEVGGGYTEFQNGDVIIAKITPCFENWKGALVCGLQNGAAYGTTELHVLRASDHINERFLFYMTITDGFRKLGEAEMYGAGGQKRVPPEFCKNFPIPLLPLSEQTAIADFLDRETGCINTLIAKKQALIGLLKEKRTALISRTVTRGLPPDAAREFGLEPHQRFKDSGIYYLGEIPEGWKVKRLKHLVPELTVGIVITPSKYYEDEGVPCLRSLNVSKGKISKDNLVFISEVNNQLLSKSKIFKDDLVVVRTGQTGVAAIVTEDFDGANCIDLLIIRKSKKIISKFIYYFISSAFAKNQIDAHSVGTIQSHYNTSTLSQLLFTLAPQPEQSAIATYLDRETAKIDTLIAKIEAAIARLQEYRTALITAAVTGKIDVRDHASSKEAA